MRSQSLLAELVAFPSVSSTSNTEVSLWAQKELERLGFRTEWTEYVDSNGVRKACVAGQKGNPDGRGLAYFCHTDVVPAETWSYPSSGPWQLHESAQKLFGRGSCDMKGSLACMLAAIESLQETRMTAPLTVVCTADEEIGMAGARIVAERSSIFADILRRQSRGIIGEPTLLNVVHAHKGGRGMRITSRGVAAHSSTNDGVNANFAMIPFLTDMDKLCNRIEGDERWTDKRYDPPTISLNLGINDHTSAVNITPPQSICTIYFRTMPNIDAESLVEEIRQSAQSHGLEFEIMFSGEPVYSDPDSDYVRQLLELTGTSKPSTVSYGTDGSYFRDLTDLAVVGPGSIEQAHTDNEWISLDQLHKGENLYSQLIRTWCIQT